jgi:hypothetical protein
MQFVNPDLSTKIIVSRLCAMIAALSLCSCYIEEDKKYWHLRYEPTTPEEQQAVAAQVIAIMAKTPASLSGESQNWQEAIEAATTSAKESVCTPTLWESYEFGRWTGKWKHLDKPNE